MIKRLFAGLLLLMAFAFGASLSSNFYQSGFDVRQATMTKEYYGSETVGYSSVFGSIRYLQVKNSGGEDMSYSIQDDAGTSLYSATVAPAATHTNRTLPNYTNYGVLNLVCANNFTGGGSLPTGLVSFWKLDEGTGNTTADVNAANTLELPSAQGEGDNTWTTSGRFYNATTLDGVNDTLRLNDSATVNGTASTSFAWAFWLYPNAALGTNKSAYLYHKGVKNGNVTPVPISTGVNSTALQAINNTAIKLFVNTNVTQRTVTYNSADFSTAAWSHYSVTFNGTDLKLYINGALASNDTPTTTQNLNWTSQNWLFGDGFDTGNNSVAYFANWNYYSIMYFNTSLTAAQVSYLYNQTKKVNLQTTVIAVR